MHCSSAVLAPADLTTVQAAVPPQALTLLPRTAAEQGGEVSLQLQGSCLPSAGRAPAGLLPQLVGMLRTAAAELPERSWSVQASSVAALRGLPAAAGVNGACLDGGVTWAPVLARDAQHASSKAQFSGEAVPGLV